MKARTARLHYLVVFVLALVGTTVFSAIIAISAIFPFASSALTNFISGKFADFNNKRRPAVEAARAKQAALKKEQAKLNKEKKELAKKKQQVLNKQAKKIYEERVSEGYEASVNMINATYTNAALPEKNEKPVKNKKAVKPTKVEKLSVAEPPAVAIPEQDPVVENRQFDGDDYMANGSMFRGISF